MPRDKTDEQVITATIAGSAELVVSADAELPSIGSFEGIGIGIVSISAALRLSGGSPQETGPQAPPERARIATMGAIDELPPLQRHRLTVDEYYRMAEVGVLAPDARVELIDGEIIDMAPQKSRHASVVNEIAARLHQAVGRRAVITCQTPLRLSQRSEPEPDLMLLRPRADGYAQAHPNAADVLLLVEVADSSARYDREIKLPLYARHGVAEVWIVDLEAGLLRQRRLPAGEAYAESTDTATPGTSLLPGLPGMAIDLSGLLA